MGLDMYLHKRTYIGNYHREKSEQVKIKVEGIKQERVSEISEQVAYWRKANHIHKWFVDNVQEGEDDCKEYYVDHEKLQELYQLVCDVNDDHSKAPKLLPTQEGFFFGGTDYDEYYFEWTEETEKMLAAVLKEEGDFYYRASW